MFEEKIFNVSDMARLAPRVEFAALVEQGLIKPGTKLYFQKDISVIAHVRPNGKLMLQNGLEGSIHQVGKTLMKGSPCNGWDHWFYEDESGQLRSIDELREKYRRLINE